MTVTNPFTLATLTSVPEPETTPVTTPATPYADLCADPSRPAAFAVAFVEPTAA